MKKKNEFIIQKIDENSFDVGNNSSINQKRSTSKSSDNKDYMLTNLSEIDRQIMKLIQKRDNLNLLNKSITSIENKSYEPTNIIDNKIINSNKNKYINYILQIDQLKKEESKISPEKCKYNIFENNNNEMFFLISNYYYKDICLNLKNNEMNNGKNFIRKDKFKNFNQNNFENNSNNYMSFHPYNNYPNQISNSQQFFTYNNFNQINEQAFQYNFPVNNITINNQTNFFITNNINNYNNYNYNLNNKNNNIKSKEKIEPSSFIINLDNILKGIEKRTSVMIRHIPNKYTYKDLLEEINTVCKNKYDFFYLPIDLVNNCNLGYAFINFINPLHIVYFYNIFKSRKWLCFNSQKECDITFAKYQGKNELTYNIEKNIKNEDRKKMPIIFEVKNPPNVDLFKKYYEVIKKFRPELLNDINWI